VSALNDRRGQGFHVLVPGQSQINTEAYGSAACREYMRQPAAKRDNPELLMKKSNENTSDVSGSSDPRTGKWDWHRRALQSLRGRLTSDRDARHEEAGSSLDDDASGIADNATNEFDHNLAYALVSRQENALQDIEAALQRIENGTYGVCEETGEPIPEDRLKAIPWTRYTKEVQERLEREGEVEMPRISSSADAPPQFPKTM
jgi:RNA polymerase-binding protein DksA